MLNFVRLWDLHRKIWPLSVTQNLATDMTGVSLPILFLDNNNPAHPYQAIFLLYYSVPDGSDTQSPNRISSPYALIRMDMLIGDLIESKALKSEEDSNPLIGLSARPEVIALPYKERSSLQKMLFSRLDEAAIYYFNRLIQIEQADHLVDLLKLLDYFMEPPLRQDYEFFGVDFLTWLRTKTGEVSV